jgi:dTDP-glucose 4,6-dehydratase
VNFVNENYGQDSKYSLNASKSKKQLDWKQQVIFNDGVKETINWINENWDFIKQQPLDYIYKD